MAYVKISNIIFGSLLTFEANVTQDMFFYISKQEWQCVVEFPGKETWRSRYHVKTIR